jgi:mannosyltransferase
VERTHQAYAVAAILGIAAAARLTLIGQESYWYDEIWAVKQIRQSLPDLFSDLSRNDQHPPLYPTLLWMWTRLFGEAEWVTRAMSALFGTASVAGIYLLGRALYDRRTALIAALLLALNPFAVYYSQESRAYAMLLMIGVFASWALVRWCDAPNSWRRGGVYLLTAIFLAYAHNFGLFLLVAHGAFVMCFVPDRRLPIVVVGGGVLLAYAPWFQVALGQLEGVSRGFWIHPLTLASPAEWLSDWAGYNPPLAVLGVALVLDGSHGHPNTVPESLPVRRHRRAFQWFWIAATIGIPVAISLWVAPLFRPKYAITVLIPFTLLAACSLAAMSVAWRRWVGGLVVTGMLASLVGVLYMQRTKSQYRELAALAHTARTNGMLLAAEQIAAYHLDYYLADPDAVAWLSDDDDVDRLARLAKQRNSDILYLLVHPPHSKREPRLEQVLRPIGEIKLHQARAVRYRAR